MKILLLTNHLNFGGITAYVISLARELKKRGHIPIVASAGGELLPILEMEGIRHLKVPLNTKSELSFKIWITSMKLSSFIKREKVEIIHAQTRVSQVAACLISKWTGVCFVSTCHGFFKNNLGRRMMPCWGCGVIAISEAVREHLVNDFGVEKERVYLINNGVEIGKFKESKSLRETEEFKRKINVGKDDIVVGIIARLSSVKGHRFLLMAAKEMLEVNKKIKILIIGSGPEKNNLLQLTKKLDIEKYVIFSEPLLNTSVALKALDIFVMPSIQEGLGLAILEAMASALPVVASNVGGIYTLVKDGVNGFLVPPAAPEAISEAVLKLIKEPSLAAEMGAAGQKIAAEQFSLAEMSDKTIALYVKALGGKFIEISG